MSAAVVEAARAANRDVPVVDIVTPGERQRLNLIELRKLLELRHGERHGA